MHDIIINNDDDMHGIDNKKLLSMLDDINDDVDLYINMLLDDNKYNKILNGAEKSVCAGTESTMHARFFTGAGTPLIGEAQAGTEKIVCCIEDGIRI
jgi:hypothetical protein